MVEKVPLVAVVSVRVVLVGVLHLVLLPVDMIEQGIILKRKRPYHWLCLDNDRV